jgi:hypothetical protein
MIERIEEMPARTVGLRASGKLSKEDYREVLEPALTSRGARRRGPRQSPSTPVIEAAAGSGEPPRLARLTRRLSRSR